MCQLINRVKKFLGKDEEGATMVEYGIMVALIAVVCIAAVTTLGGNIKTVFTDIATAVAAV